MPVDPTRRRFLSQAAGVAAGGAVLTLATIPPASAATAPASPLDPDPVHPDATLLELEEKIFEQYELAAVYDDEIIRLSNIWSGESQRLYRQSLDADGNCSLSPQERWNLVTEMPECVEHNRLCNLQEPFLTKMDALIKQMFAIPAHTAEGRRAKATVLLGCVLGDDWRGRDEETEYPERLARNLLIEFVGGEPAAQLRDQFA